MRRKILMNGLSTDGNTMFEKYDELVNTYKEAYQNNVELFFFDYLTSTQKAILMFIYIKGEVNNVSTELRWVSNAYAHTHNLLKIFKDLGIIDSIRTGRISKITLTTTFRNQLMYILTRKKRR